MAALWSSVDMHRAVKSESPSTGPTWGGAAWFLVSALTLHAGSHFTPSVTVGFPRLNFVGVLLLSSPDPKHLKLRVSCFWVLEGYGVPYRKTDEPHPMLALEKASEAPSSMPMNPQQSIKMASLNSKANNEAVTHYLPFTDMQRATHKQCGLMKCQQ